MSLAVIKSICKLSYCSVSVSKLWRIKLDSQIWAVGSVTRNWCKYVAQMFPKVAQINVVFTYSDPFQNSPKSHHYFWITLESPFVAKNSEKSSNLSHWLWISILGNVPISVSHSLRHKNLLQRQHMFYLSHKFARHPKGCDTLTP